jgi:hypothetical protein
MKVDREQFLNDLEMVKAGLSAREFLEQSSCLSKDSVIHTLGGDYSIASLLAAGKTDFLVYSTDGKRLRIGQASNLRKTRENAEVFQVVFDTGHTIKMTSDHLVMMRDGSYLPVHTLKKGDSVMPFNHRFDQGYCWIYAGIDTGRQRAHEWVYEEKHGGRKINDSHIHHRDADTWNNHPDNLNELPKGEHLGLHTRLNPPARLPHVRRFLSERMMGNGISSKKKPWISEMKRGKPLSEETKRRISEATVGKKKERRGKHQRPMVNHKVVSVEFVGREDVYDLSVEKYHNFAVNGIFVHNCYVFTDGWVMTFNDEVACRKKVGISVTGAVQATSLLNILQKLDDPELKVRENDKGELEFAGQKKGFGVTKDAEIFLPIDRVEMPADDRWRSLPKEFTEAVGLVQHCVSTDESRFLLTCIHLHPEFIEACDNLQVMRVKITTGLKKSVLVRGASLAHIVSLAMDEVSLTASWIHFRNQAGLIFSCRRYSEDYPDLEKITLVKGHTITIPKGMVEASDRAAVFATDKSGDPLVEVSLSSGAIRIRGEGLSGWYREAKSVNYEGPSMAFLIAPDLLKHISEKYQEAIIGQNKLKVSGGHWDYITVLGIPEEKPEEGEADEPPAKAKKKAKDSGRDES